MAKLYILVQKEVELTGRYDFTDLKFSLEKKKLEEELRRMIWGKEEYIRPYEWDKENYFPVAITNIRTEECFFIKEVELV